MRISSTFIRYLVVGASNTVVGLGVIYCAWRFLHWGDLPANLLGYGIGFGWSYVLNRMWTFRDTGAALGSLMRFTLVCAMAYAVNLLVLFLARRWMGGDSFVPHVAGMAAYTAVGYLGSQFFAFRSPAALLDAAPDYLIRGSKKSS